MKCLAATRPFERILPSISAYDFDDFPTHHLSHLWATSFLLFPVWSFHFLASHSAGALFSRWTSTFAVCFASYIGCWHTAAEFSGGTPPAMWESLGYCTIVFVFECVGLTLSVILGKHWILLGAHMFTMESCFAIYRDCSTINVLKIEMDLLDKSHIRIGRTVDRYHTSRTIFLLA
jgi:hypothetical protein